MNSLQQTTEVRKPSLFLSREEATLNYLLKQIRALPTISLTMLGGALLDEVDERRDRERMEAAIEAYELQEWQEA